MIDLQKSKPAFFNKLSNGSQPFRTAFIAI